MRGKSRVGRREFADNRIQERWLVLFIRQDAMSFSLDDSLADFGLVEGRVEHQDPPFQQKLPEEHVAGLLFVGVG